MKNRFTSIVVTTIVAISVTLFAFTYKNSTVEKKADATTCKMSCPKDHCPASPNCPYDKTKDDCCGDK